MSLKSDMTYNWNILQLFSVTPLTSHCTSWCYWCNLVLLTGVLPVFWACLPSGGVVGSPPWSWLWPWRGWAWREIQNTALNIKTDLYTVIYIQHMHHHTTHTRSIIVSLSILLCFTDFSCLTESVIRFLIYIRSDCQRGLGKDTFSQVFNSGSLVCTA